MPVPSREAINAGVGLNKPSDWNSSGGANVYTTTQTNDKSFMQRVLDFFNPDRESISSGYEYTGLFRFIFDEVTPFSETARRVLKRLINQELASPRHPFIAETTIGITWQEMDMLEHDYEGHYGGPIMSPGRVLTDALFGLAVPRAALPEQTKDLHWTGKAVSNALLRNPESPKVTYYQAIVKLAEWKEPLNDYEKTLLAGMTRTKTDAQLYRMNTQYLEYIFGPGYLTDSKTDFLATYMRDQLKTFRPIFEVKKAFTIERDLVHNQRRIYMGKGAKALSKGRQPSNREKIVLLDQWCAKSSSRKNAFLDNIARLAGHQLGSSNANNLRNWREVSSIDSNLFWKQRERKPR